MLIQQADHAYVLNSYDENENLLSTTDQLGRTTSYQYDGLNRVSTQTLPDGAATTFGYDSAGNILSLTMPAGLTWSATYDNASQRMSETLKQSPSSTPTRSSSYTYYSSNGNGGMIGKLETIIDGRGIVTTYKYDGFGRMQQQAATDGTNQLGVTLSFQYNNRSLATEIDQSYQNPSLSPPTSVKRSFDGYGAISAEQVYLNGKLKDNWQAIHDITGRRSSLTEVDLPSNAFSYSYQADGLMTQAYFGNSGGGQYTYGTDGLLIQRSSPTHYQQITARDPVGRILTQNDVGYSAALSGTVGLTEQVQWRGDSTLASNAIVRDLPFNPATIGPGDPGLGNYWYETRNYTYDARGHVTSEGFTPTQTTTASLAYVFDNNTGGLLGQRTSATLSGSLSGNETSNYSSFARLNNFTTAGAVSGPLGTPTAQTFDGMGQLITHNPGTSADVLTWDALGRLINVQRNPSGNGFTWSAIYDGLGRRLQTSNQQISNGVMSGQPLLIQSSYDPDVEFMELAVTVVGGTRDWLVHGPDLNGVYGGLHGTGGLEQVFNDSTKAITGIVSDIYGHTEATVTQLFGSQNIGGTWNPVVSLGYGPAPGYSASPIDATHDLTTVLAWRGHYIDPTGFYYLGTRYYDPQSGVFLSSDPLGHAVCMDLYSAFAGDPVNNFDADGRVSSSVSTWQQNEDTRLSDISDADVLGDENNPALSDAFEHMVTNPILSELNSVLAFTKNDTGLNSQSLNDVESGLEYGTLYEAPIAGSAYQGIEGITGTPYFNPISNSMETDTTTQGAINLGLAGVQFGLVLAPELLTESGAPSASLEVRTPSVPAPTNCFPPGTEVLMADGSTKSIESVVKGDQVLATDPTTSREPRPLKVVNLIKSYTEHLVAITVRDSTGKTAQFRATREHPFWVKGKGWKTAKDLVKDDRLDDRNDNNVYVINVKIRDALSPTYNLTIDEKHTFYIANNGVSILVHNANPNQVGTVKSLNGGINVGDQLDAHEILQALKLNVSGLGGRGSINQINNPAIALDEFSHQTITNLQVKYQMDDPAVISQMPAEAVIDMNYQILEEASRVKGTNIDMNAARTVTSNAMDYAASIGCP